MSDIYDSRTDLGYRDIARSFAQAGLIWTLAMREIRSRYRRSTLGPFWITASMIATVLGMSFVFSALMNRPFAEYVPYLATGMAIWALFTGIVSEGSGALIRAAPIVRYSTAPISSHLFRHQLEQLIFFAHNILPAIAIVIAIGAASVAGALLSLLGLALAVIAVGWMGFFAAIISTRFRDVPQIVLNAMQVFFFVTPVIWHADDLGRNRFVIDYNPFYYLVAVVRDPLMGAIPPIHVWIVAAIIAGAGWAATALLFQHLYGRLTKWL